MRTVYASSADKLATFPPSIKLFPADPNATVILRPSKTNVNTSPYWNTSQEWGPALEGSHAHLFAAGFEKSNRVIPVAWRRTNEGYDMEDFRG